MPKQPNASSSKLGSGTSSVPPAGRIKEKGARPQVPAERNARKSEPRVINVDKNAAYPKAIAELKACGMLSASVELRQVKYLNNLIEQDHCFIKRLVKPGMGFFSFETAQRTFQGYEAMHMIRKGQVRGVKKATSAIFSKERCGVSNDQSIDLFGEQHGFRLHVVPHERKGSKQKRSA